MGKYPIALGIYASPVQDVEPAASMPLHERGRTPFAKRVICRKSQPILNRLDVSKTQQVVRIWVVMRYLLSLTKEGLFLFLAAQR